MNAATQDCNEIDILANHFVGYLFDEYRGTKHVRRVATWLGFILVAVSKLDERIERKRSRQVAFGYRGQRFKVRYNHEAGFRGGIEIVHVLSLPGSPEGNVVAAITSLAEAEDLYLTLQLRIDAFLDNQV